MRSSLALFLYAAVFVTSVAADEYYGDREDAGDIQKCTVESCNRETFAALEKCAAGTRPQCDSDTGCPTCVVPTCEKDLSTIPECESTEHVGQKDDDGCPTCKPIVCPSLSSLDACEENTKPTRNEKGCYTCRPVLSVTSCTREELATNCADDVPVCSTADLGRRHDWENCCQKCTVPDTLYECASHDAIDACRALLSDDSELLPECAPGQKPERDTDTCCYDCKVPSPINCPATRDAFQACLTDLRTCGDGEVPVIQGCCPSCNPFVCSADEVAKCAADRPTCTDTIRPTRIEGECCPSCIPRPVCSEECDEDEVCIRGECRDATRARLIFKVTDAEERRRLAALSVEEAREFLREKITRFCSRPENEERCARLRDSLDAIRLENFGAQCAEGEDELPADSLCARLAAVNENTEGQEVDVAGRPIREDEDREDNEDTEEDAEEDAPVPQVTKDVDDYEHGTTEGARDPTEAPGAGEPAGEPEVTQAPSNPDKPPAEEDEEPRGKRADNSDTTMGVAASAMSADGDYVEESSISASLVAEPESEGEGKDEPSSAARFAAVTPLVAFLTALAF
jgi:hypothetical protein